MENRNQLRESMAHYGYALVSPVSAAEPEEVLQELLKQDDPRLLEGFPVVLANAMREKKLTWEAKGWKPQAALKASSLRRLGVLLGVSQALFQLFSLEDDLPGRARQLALKTLESGEDLAALQEDFLNRRTVKLERLKLSADRFTTAFRNYVVHAPASKEAREQRHELELELLLSRLFTARQKDLLKKRLAGKPMTKTEQEYFYRVVKKRLKALANDDLHKMAKALVS
ncbi:MAG: hypothetical protein H6757_02605 [Candidatus Omnitrophica bacterium]|nr:hypothetical protein [Candidatus Omnitrophota bacterium]